MIWSKTDAGRAECQTRSLVKERAQRNLLLLIDGVKTEATLLASVAGTRIEDFKALEAAHLIAPVVSHGHHRSSGAAPAAEPAAKPASAGDGFLDYSQFTATLTQLISSELGLRGFTLTLAVEKANSIEELRDVANRVIDLIRDRKGEPVAEKARRALYGA